MKAPKAWLVPPVVFPIFLITLTLAHGLLRSPG